jgi:hypothetical protein
MTTSHGYPKAIQPGKWVLVSGIGTKKISRNDKSEIRVDEKKYYFQLLVQIQKNTNLGG